MSQGQDRRRHFKAFAVWTAARFVLIAAVLVLLPRHWLAAMWVGHSRRLVLLAFCAFYFSVPLRAFLIQTAESVRQTVFIQASLAAFSALETAALFVLWRLELLSVSLALLLLSLEYAGLLLFFLWRFNWNLVKGSEQRSRAQIVDQYASYCAPLVVMSLLDFPCQFADRWLLQRFGGSVEQGYFSFGQQFSTIALLATVSLLNIFWKEIAEAQSRGDWERVRGLYRRASRGLFFTAACGAGLLIPYSAWILTTLAGPQFAGGAVALGFMLLFPAFQSLGQLNGVYLYATEDTRTHMAITAAASLAGLPLTYLVLAPLGLGAAGLAGRWSLFLMLVISVQSWIVARRQKTRADLINPFLVLGFLLTIGFAAKLLGAALAEGAAAFVVSAVFYGACVAAFLYRFPDRAGTSREEIARMRF